MSQSPTDRLRDLSGLTLLLCLRLVSHRHPTVSIFKIHQAAVPAVKKQVFRLESARLGRVDQVPEMVILGLAIIRLVIDPVIAWQAALAIGPKQH